MRKVVAPPGFKGYKPYGNRRGGDHHVDLLYEEYEALYEAYIGLPKVKFSPSPDTISNILSYSRQSSAVVLR